MEIRTYDIENDELCDVLNDSPINGLSFASIHQGELDLYVVDGWTENSLKEVKNLSDEFGGYKINVIH